MADKISFLVKLPPKSAPDVVRRILTVNIGEDNQTGIDTDKELTEFGPLTGDEGAAIKITLVDVDNAGNQSEPSVFEGVLADTFAPPAPGAIGVVAVGESFEQEPAPEPTPNPAPVDPPVEEVPSGPQGAQDVPPSDA